VSTEVSPGTAPSSAGEWFARLGISGKVLLIAAAFGVLSCFLPLMTMSIQTFGQQISKSALVINDWRGVVALLGYAGVIGLTFLLYPAGRAPEKGLAWAALGVGGFVALMTLWLLILALNSGASFGFGGFGGAKVSAGIGAFLNVLAGLAVAGGGVLKAREEKLF